jgi:hypothetical protein
MNGDAVAGDHIFTAVQNLVTDAGNNTWSWGVNDENHTWVDIPYATFTLPTADPQTLTAVVLGATSQDVTVTFYADLSAVDPAIYAGGVSVQGDVLPLDWTNGSNMMTYDGSNFMIQLLFPMGSPRHVQYKFGAFDQSNNWTWENFFGNHSFLIDDTSPTQTLPVVAFLPSANDDNVAATPSIKLTSYPNPFYQNVMISYEIPKGGYTKIEVFNMKGQLVRTLVNESLPKGVYHISWDSRDDFGKYAASGVYAFKLHSNGTMIGKKVILLK